MIDAERVAGCEKRDREERSKRTRYSRDRAAKDYPQSIEFDSLTSQMLDAGLGFRFQARGASMSPLIENGDIVYVEPVSNRGLRERDVVLVKSECGFRLHRLVSIDAAEDFYVTRGDRRKQDDPPVRMVQIVGVAIAKDVRLGRRKVRAELQGMWGWSLRFAARIQSILQKVGVALHAILPETEKA